MFVYKFNDNTEVEQDLIGMYITIKTHCDCFRKKIYLLIWCRSLLWNCVIIKNFTILAECKFFKLCLKIVRFFNPSRNKISIVLFTILQLKLPKLYNLK